MATLDQEPGMSDGQTATKAESAPLGGTRAQAAQRLQMGVVPQASATSEPEVEQAQSDPLVEAGVVPDLPSTLVPEATTEEPILPEQGIVQDMEDVGPAKSGNGGQSDQDETVEP